MSKVKEKVGTPKRVAPAQERSKLDSLNADCIAFQEQFYHHRHEVEEIEKALAENSCKLDALKSRMPPPPAGLDKERDGLLVDIGLGRKPRQALVDFDERAKELRDQHEAAVRVVQAELDPLVELADALLRRCLHHRAEAERVRTAHTFTKNAYIKEDFDEAVQEFIDCAQRTWDVYNRLAGLLSIAGPDGKDWVTESFRTFSIAPIFPGTAGKSWGRWEIGQNRAMFGFRDNVHRATVIQEDDEAARDRLRSHGVFLTLE